MRILSYIRFGGEILTLAATAIFLTLDIVGVAAGIPQEDGTKRSILWEWWALGAFVVFVVLVAARIIELRQQLGSEAPDLRFHSEPRIEIKYHTKNEDGSETGSPTLIFPVQNFGRQPAYNIGVLMAYGDHRNPSLLNWNRAHYKYVTIAGDDPFHVRLKLDGLDIHKRPDKTTPPDKIRSSEHPVTTFLGLRYATKENGAWTKSYRHWASFNPGSKFINVATNQQVEAFLVEVNSVFALPIPDTSPDSPQATP